MLGSSSLGSARPRDRPITKPAGHSAEPSFGHPVGCQNSITPLTSGFLLAREGPDRCFSRLVAEPHKPQESQNSSRALRNAPCELEVSGVIEF